MSATVEQGGELPQTPPLQPPHASLLNRSTNAMPGSEARLVRDIQLPFEESANRYALAPAGCAPSCSAEDNARLEKEKSHSFELAWLFSLPVKLELIQNREGSHSCSGLCKIILAYSFRLVNTSFEKRTSPQKRACRYSFRVNYHLAFVGLFNCVVRKLGNVFA